MGQVVKLGDKPGPAPTPKPSAPEKQEKRGREQGAPAMASLASSELLTPRNLAIGGGVIAVIVLGIVVFSLMGGGGGSAAGGAVPQTTAVDYGNIPAEPGSPAPGAAAGAASEIASPGIPTYGGASPGYAAGAPVSAGTPAADSGLPPGHTLGTTAGGASVSTVPGAANPGAPGAGTGAVGNDVQYGPRPPVSVPKPGGGSWQFQPREDPS
jgi:hypothetical protein